VIRPSKQSVQRGAVFNRRMVLLGGAQLIAFGLIGTQLYRLQVERSADLADIGREVITRQEYTLPERGSITDRSGRALAFNRANRVAVLRIRNYPDPPENPDVPPKKDLTKFAAIFDLDEEAQTRIRLDIDFAFGFIPAEFYLRQLALLRPVLQEAADFVDLAELAYNGGQEVANAVIEDLRREDVITLVAGISSTQRDLLQVKLAEIPLVELGTRFERQYEGSGKDNPNDLTLASLSHVLGYTRRVFKEDLFSDSDRLLTLPGARIGARGIERAYDPTLRGVAGSRTWQITGGGRKLRELARTAPIKGKDISLTIDLPLQRAAVGLISPYPEAAVVLLNVHNGEILAMASKPSFDGNDFVPRIGFDKYQAYLDDPLKPLYARASMGSYPPGSTFKMVGTLAALEAGFDSRTTYNCPGYFEVSGQRFRCWKREGHGDVDMLGALRESCDVWYYNMSSELGLDPMRAVAAKFGFGTAMIENFYEQSTALLPSRSWKERTRDEPWSIGDSIQFAIGQGFMLATPLQLAAMTAAIANGGYTVRPHFVLAGGFFEQKEPLGFDAAHLQLVREGMYQVVNSATGTARRSALQLPLGDDGKIWRMAGKTGTAQVTALPPDEFDDLDEDVPYDLRDHALFVGFAPFDNPQFAAAVVIEHGGSGSATAAPVARNLLNTALARYAAGHLS